MVEGVSPHISSRAPQVAQRASRYDTVPMTGFYPMYDGDEDQVDRIARISSVAFQRVIPRYRLSSSATRDTGLGPAFYDVPVYRSGGNLRPAGSEPPSQEIDEGSAPFAVGPIAGKHRSAPLYPWQGQQIDILV